MILTCSPEVVNEEEAKNEAVLRPLLPLLPAERPAGLAGICGRRLRRRLRSSLQWKYG